MAEFRTVEKVPPGSWYLDRIGGKQPLFLPINGERVVGRRHALNGKTYVSPFHAVVETATSDSGQFHIIRDKGSKFGTYVQDVEVPAEGRILTTKHFFTLGQKSCSSDCYFALRQRPYANETQGVLKGYECDSNTNELNVCVNETEIGATAVTFASDAIAERSQINNEVPVVDLFSTVEESQSLREASTEVRTFSNYSTVTNLNHGKCEVDVQSTTQSFEAINVVSSSRENHNEQLNNNYCKSSGKKPSSVHDPNIASGNELLPVQYPTIESLHSSAENMQIDCPNIAMKSCNNETNNPKVELKNKYRKSSENKPLPVQDPTITNLRVHPSVRNKRKFCSAIATPRSSNTTDNPNVQFKNRYRKSSGNKPLPIQDPTIASRHPSVENTQVDYSNIAMTSSSIAISIAKQRKIGLDQISTSGGEKHIGSTTTNLASHMQKNVLMLSKNKELRDRWCSKLLHE